VDTATGSTTEKPKATATKAASLSPNHQQTECREDEAVREKFFLFAR
jgi:hypothetical protein